MDAFLNPAAFHELPSVPPSPFLAAGEMATGMQICLAKSWEDRKGTRKNDIARVIKAQPLM